MKIIFSIQPAVGSLSASLPSNKKIENFFYVQYMTKVVKIFYSHCLRSQSNIHDGHQVPLELEGKSVFPLTSTVALC